MKLLIQRVLEAKVEVSQKIISEISEGLLVFVGFEESDSQKEIEIAVSKLKFGRFFENDEGKPHYSALDLGRPLLLVSQFTLCADLKQGRRPDFTRAMRSERALESFKTLLNLLEREGLKVLSGEFGAYMKVSLINDGPFTLQWSS